MTSISTKEVDYYLVDPNIDDCDNDCDRRTQKDAGRPPEVVTVSAIDELRSTLRERDARIAFLEKELVETRLQLALAKTSEDRLLHELKRMGPAARPGSAPPQSVVGVEGAVEGGAVGTAGPSSATGRKPHLIRANSSSPLGSVVEEISSGRWSRGLARFQSERRSRRLNGTNNTVFMPLGQPIIPDVSKKPDISNATMPPPPPGAIRKRSVEEEESFGALSSCRNLNPGSCASGLYLMLGHVPSSNNVNLMPLGSTSSINRMLGDIGLSSSEISLNKRFRSGDVAAGRPNMNSMAGGSRNSSLRNAGWGDEVAPLSASMPPRNNNPFLNGLLD